jgi:hypothetical protein
VKKNIVIGFIAESAAIALILATSLSPAVAQEAGNAGITTAKKGAPHAPTPKTADGKPDLSGVWRPQGFSNDFTKVLAPGETMEPLPWAAKLTASRMSKDDPEANCLPAGVPRTAPYPWKIIQAPAVIVFLFEGNIHSYRQIFMDRADHPKNLVDNPTWYGDSIGKWDKDTLVVDTIGFNDRFWFDFAGHPHTEQLHTIERYRRIDMETLEDRATVIDPGAYSKPFTLLATMPRLHEDLMEYICQENNRDVQHIVGKDGVDRPVR